MGDTGIEPVASSVSGKRATAAPIARIRKSGLRVTRLRADDEIRTRDIHLGKVVLYQLSYVRSAVLRSAIQAFRRFPTSKNSIGGSCILQIGSPQVVTEPLGSLS